MDGVLVDWVKAVTKLLGWKKYPCPGEHDCIPFMGLDTKEFWKKLERKWYAGLKWTEDGKEILKCCTRVGAVMICTAYTSEGGCLAGKLDWIQRELPKYERRIIFTNQKFLCNKGDILVDDCERNIESWGDRGILVPRIWNSLGNINAVKYVKEKLHDYVRNV